MSPVISLLAALLSFLFAFPTVAAFSFSFAQAPTECDNLTITWNGGTPPFQISLLHIFGTQRNISIPASAFNNGQGSYAFPIPIAKGEQLMLMMSDATGYNTGGVSNVLDVGPSQGGSCNSTDPGVAFEYQLNTALQQCRPFTFSSYTGAAQPITIAAIVPGGNAILLTPPVGPTSYTWPAASVARGTSMVFVLTDSQGRSGGVSDIETVTSSDDNTCLNANSPASTSLPPTTPTPTSTNSTPTGTNSSSDGQTSSPTPTATPANSFSIAAIAGTVIGALLFLALAITLGLFFLRKRHEDAKNNFRRHSRVVDPQTDLTYVPSAPSVGSYGRPPSGNAIISASPYPYSPGGPTPQSSDPFLDINPPPGHGSTRSYDAASMYTDARYANSETGQFDMPSHYQYGPPPSQTQLYPPSRANYPPSTGPSAGDPFNPYADFDPSTPSSQSQSQATPQGSTRRTSVSTSTAQRKAAAAGVTPYKPSRFIIHTDVEDALPPTSEEEIIELPPQYSERRGPVTPITQPNTQPGHAPGGNDTELPYS